MTLTVEIAGVAITGAIAPSSIAGQCIASDGDVGFGGFDIDDPGASIVTTGHKSVTIEESSCSQPRLFTGYLTDRDIGRSTDRGMIVDDDRLHDASIVDLNACLNFRHLRGTESERPAETMEDRLTWLLGTDQVSQFITGTGFVTAYSNMMDAANYRGAYPRAVLDDLAGRRANLTYFVFWDPAAEEVALYFGDDSTGIADSTLYVSNDIADINGTTVFPPDTTATLKRSPEEVYSEVTVRYAHGTKMLYRRRASTASAYVDRGTVIDKPYTGSLTTAQGQAEAFLDKHAVETDRISCTIIVPPESAGLVTAGQRMNVKFMHLDDYTAWTSMRVVSVNVRPINDVANRYALDLELEKPKAGTVPSAGCTGGPYLANDADHNAALSADVTMANNFSNSMFNPDRATNGDLLDYSDFDTSVLGAGTYYELWTIDLGATKRIYMVSFRGACPTHNSPGVRETAWSLLISDSSDGTSGSTACTITQEDGGIWDFDDIIGLVKTTTFTPSAPTTGRYIHLRHDFTMSGLGGHSGAELNELLACASDTDDEQEQTPTPTPAGTAVQTTTDPTVNDDLADGYQVGQVWINTTTGDVFVLTDNTEGAAVWLALAGVSDHGALTGLLDDDHTQYVLKTYGGKEVVNTVAASGATETLDLADGNVHDVTLTADCTLTFTGATNGVACSFTLLLRQDGTGGWTTTWPGSVIWPDGTAPTLDETASTVSVLTFFTLDGGTNWYGFATGGGGGGTPGDTVEDETTWGITPDAGVATEYSRADHTHGSPAEPTAGGGGVGPILIEDTPAGSPLVFADLLQNEEGTDLLYADTV